MRTLEHGIELEDGPIAADRARIVGESSKDRTLVELTLHSGRNRIVRRMLDHVGHPVLELVRRQFGPLHLGTLAQGSSRDLTKVELGQLLTLSREEHPRMNDRRLSGQVRIVGSGLLGASIGLGLRAHGVDVIVEDASPSARNLAIAYGAGRAPAADDAPGLIVVAVPPDVTADVVAAELERYPDALVTDVASVKVAPLDELRARGADLSRYLGTHPMAGRERGGAVSARADLFIGRPWILAGHDGITLPPGGARSST